MTDNMIELAKRAVACKGWRWMPGMLLADGAWRARVGENWPWCAGAEVLPVLDDHATLGCLLAIYEETRKMLTCPDPVYTMVAAWGLMHPRTLDALVAALEAAP